MLQDSSERTITTLRVSVTDRCNLRCLYCMPDHGVPFIPHEEILRYEEIERIIKVASQIGITRIRLTGGEPLIRKGLIEFIQQIQRLQDIRQIILTTNGLLLPRYATALKCAGTAYLNISLDTLKRNKFRQITRFDKLNDVLHGIDAAQNAGFSLIKINVVAMRGINDDELFDFADFAHTHNLHVRFIEYMPFPGNSWQHSGFIPSRELQKRLTLRYTLIPHHEDPSAPARTYSIPGRNGRIGFISPVSKSFCHRCNRLRLTSDGCLRPCLHSPEELDIKSPLRRGASDTDIANIFWEAIEKKPRSHQDFLDHCYCMSDNDREMVRIGG